MHATVCWSLGMITKASWALGVLKVYKQKTWYAVCCLWMPGVCVYICLVCIYVSIYIYVSRMPIYSLEQTWRDSEKGKVGGGAGSCPKSRQWAGALQPRAGCSHKPPPWFGESLNSGGWPLIPTSCSHPHGAGGSFPQSMQQSFASPHAGSGHCSCMPAQGDSANSRIHRGLLVAWTLSGLGTKWLPCHVQQYVGI